MMITFANRGRSKFINSINLESLLFPFHGSCSPISLSYLKFAYSLSIMIVLSTSHPILHSSFKKRSFSYHSTYITYLQWYRYNKLPLGTFFKRSSIRSGIWSVQYTILQYLPISDRKDSEYARM